MCMGNYDKMGMGANSKCRGVNGRGCECGKQAVIAFNLLTISHLSVTGN